MTFYCAYSSDGDKTYVSPFYGQWRNEYFFDWLVKVERLFLYTKIEETKKVDFVACRLEYEAFAWWTKLQINLSDIHNLRTESLEQQYRMVKTRTSNHNTYRDGSHVMQYGNVVLNNEELSLYMGSNPANDNFTFIDDNKLPLFSSGVNQRDADLLHLWHKFRRSPEGSSKKLNAQKQLVDAMAHRLHIDNSVELIMKLLFGSNKGSEVMKTVRPAGQPLVDDWDCLKTMVRTFETHCGSLSQYGMKHMRSISNICNAGITMETMAEVSAQACITIPSNPYSSLHRGFSA